MIKRKPGLIATVLLSVMLTDVTDAAAAIKIESHGTGDSRAYQYQVSQVSKTIERALALLAKFTPGMSYNDTVKLLDAAAFSHVVGGGSGDRDLVRKGWLHGEFGIEIYFLKGQAYRIDVVSQFGSETDVLHALNIILQWGRSKYKSMPQWDSVAGEHYWDTQDVGGLRFGYARTYRSSMEVRVSRKSNKQ